MMVRVFKAIGISLVLFFLFSPLQAVFGVIGGVIIGAGLLLWIFEDKLNHSDDEPE